MCRLAPRYQFVYGTAHYGKPMPWNELLTIIASRRHYGLRPPVRVERVI